MKTSSIIAMCVTITGLVLMLPYGVYVIYNGILEITNKKGKIVTSSIKTGIRLGAGESMKTPSVSTNTDLEYMPAGHDAGAELNDTQMDFTQVLVQKLLELPKEDLSFLSKDIPDEIWNTLIQYK